MSIIQWGKKSHQQMRVSQGVIGGKTSPLEPTLEGADFYDPIAQEVVHEENGLELIRELEGYEAPVADDPEKQERSHEKHFPHGMFSKQYLLDNKVKASDELRLKIKNSLIGNIQPSESEWDYCQVDMSIFAPQDMSRARKIIFERVAHPKYLAIKDNGPAGMTYVPIDGDRAVLVWGNHLDQDIGPHLQFWRHHHAINNKKLVFDKDLNKIIDKTDDSGNRYITQATSLDKDFIRKIELDWINEGLREAHLPTIDNIYLKNESKDNDKAEAKLRVENEDVSKWQDLYDKTIEENKKARELNIEFDPNSEKDAILSAELRILDEVVKVKKELSAEYLSKAIKEKNEVEAFERAKKTVIELHQERAVNTQLTEKLEDTETKLLETTETLVNESKLRADFEDKLGKTSFELTETKVELGNTKLELENLGKDYDDLEKTYSETLVNHKEEIKTLHENHDNTVKDLITAHKEEIDRIDLEHSDELTALDEAHKEEIKDINARNVAIVSGLNTEIAGLKANVSTLTTERDGFKFDKEELEKEVADLKRAMAEMASKHKEELDKERKDRSIEKVSFEQIIKDLKEDKIKADEAISLLTKDNEKLVEEVKGHINKYEDLKTENNKLKTGLNDVKVENDNLKNINTQLEADNKALMNEIKKDIESKNKNKNDDNKNKNKPK